MAALMGTVQQTQGLIASVKSCNASVDKSKEISQQRAQMTANGASAWMQGMPAAWQAHQASLVQWRLGNAKFFQDQANTTVLTGFD